MIAIKNKCVWDLASWIIIFHPAELKKVEKKDKSTNLINYNKTIKEEEFGLLHHS